jgi:uncharacterized protein
LNAHYSWGSPLPIIIEIVDTEEQVQQLLPHLELMVQEGMITMEYVVIIFYRPETATDPMQS